MHVTGASTGLLFGDLEAPWSELSGLLDSALDLAAPEREQWLAALPGTPAKDLLARLLAQQARVESAAFLGTLPRLSAAALARIAGDPAALAPKAGDLIGPWRLLRELGRGGMGAVWLAERSDGSLKRHVALKLPNRSWDAGFAERLLRERDILATLTHPHIARLYDAGFDDEGRPFLALEFVDGRPIDEHVQAAALDLNAILALLLQVASAVAHAHGRLVIHRDLKPGNILVDAQGQVQLLDFGIAKLMEDGRTEETALTRAAGRALTLDYASPEQVRGEALGTASDVYSFGVVAFELLAGARPYRLERGSAAELEEVIAAASLPLASQVAAAPALKKALRGDLDAILNKALKKTPADRYATVDAMAQDLARHLAGEQVAARPDSMVYRARRLAARWRQPLIAGALVAPAFGLALGVGATALVIAVLALGLAAALWQARRAQLQACEAQMQATQAQAVKGFVLDIFSSNSDQQADPKRAREATARELLDRGAERVETSLRDAPSARVEVLEILGRMYYQLGLDEQAVAIQRRRCALLRQLWGDQDRRLAEALVDLGGALHGTAGRDEILPALREAEAILDALDEPASNLRAALCMEFAKRLQLLDTVRALSYGDRACSIFRELTPRNPLGLAGALHLVARARMGKDELAAAESLHIEATALLTGLEPRSHVSLAQVRGSHCECLILQYRYADAEALASRAVAEVERALGAEDADTLFLSSKVGALRHAAGRRAEGLQILERSLAVAIHTRGSDDPLVVAQLRRELGRALYQEGRLDAAWPLVQAALDSMRKPYAGSAILAITLIQQAELAAVRGDLDLARTSFEEASELLQVHIAAPGIRRLNLMWLARARFEIDCGLAQQAMQTLARFVAPPGPVPALPVDRYLHALLLSRVQLECGDGVAALALATSTAAAVAASPAPRERPALLADARLHLARARLAAGDAVSALDPARRCADWLRDNDAAASPWAAEAERVLAECLLAAGQREEAAVVAQSAAARLALQAPLAEFLTEPLRLLTVRLEMDSCAVAVESAPQSRAPPTPGPR